MKLLIITQKVDKNDDILGFFHRWIFEFAKNCEKVIVICLYEGEHDLPKNVKVLSLGKENFAQYRVLQKIKYIVRFYRYIWQERKNYDTVFVHMNPIYVVLGGIPWRLWKKKIALWYTHRNVDIKLRVAEKIVHKIFTASKESFRLPSEKVFIIGHGIETEKFECKYKKIKKPLKILHMGRITKIKNCAMLIDVIEIFKKKYKYDTIQLIFSGSPITKEDEIYFESLNILIRKKHLENNIKFFSVRYSEIPAFFCNSDVVINLTPTGGIDKAPLSGFIAKRPTFISNTSFMPILGEYSSRFIFSYGNSADLITKIINFLSAHDQQQVLNELSRKIKTDFGVEAFILKIIRNY